MFFIWIIGGVAIALYTVILYGKLLGISKVNKYKVTEDIENVLERCLKKLKIKRKIEVVITHKINTPSLVGLVKPKILIPKELLGRVSENELRYILLHELCHLKSGDIFIAWLRAIIKTIYWFNPFVYLAMNTMEKDCEVSCDNRVLKVTDYKENISYGNTIINVLHFMGKPRALPGTTSMVASKKTLKERIMVISKNKKFSNRNILLGILVILIIGVVGLTSAKPKKLEDELKTTAKTYFRGMVVKAAETRENTTKSFLDNPENVVMENMLKKFYKVELIDIRDIKEVSKKEVHAITYYSYLEEINSENTCTQTIDTTFKKVDGKWLIAQFRTGLMSNKPISLTDNLKEPQNEYFAKYITDKGYKIIINSGMVAPIMLPKSFNEVIEGVNIGEILKERNEISKSYGLDFSSFLGNEVLFYSLAIESDRGNSEAVGLFYNGELFGFWTHEYVAKNESDIISILGKLELSTSPKKDLTDTISNSKEYKVYSLDINTEEEVILSTLDIDTSVTKLEDKLQNLAQYLAQVKFAGLPIELLKIEDIDGKKIATFNLKEAIINEKEENWNNYIGENWFNYCSGSAGGHNTSYTLIKTLLQPQYSGEWIDGVVFKYRSEAFPFQHAEGLGTISYRNNIEE